MVSQDLISLIVAYSGVPMGILCLLDNIYAKIFMLVGVLYIIALMLVHYRRSELI